MGGQGLKQWIAQPISNWTERRGFFSRSRQQLNIVNIIKILKASPWLLRSIFAVIAILFAKTQGNSHSSNIALSRTVSTGSSVVCVGVSLATVVEHSPRHGRPKKLWPDRLFWIFCVIRRSLKKCTFFKFFLERRDSCQLQISSKPTQRRRLCNADRKSVV